MYILKILVSKVEGNKQNGLQLCPWELIARIGKSTF